MDFTFTRRFRREHAFSIKTPRGDVSPQNVSRVSLSNKTDTYLFTEIRIKAMCLVCGAQMAEFKD